MDFRIALGVEYEGTNYFGFQKQKSTKQTIQGSLEESISRVADHKVKTFCSGRTDAGVHAFMQVMHFDTKAVRSSIEWSRGINSYLPKDIRVLWAKEIDENFHARFSAKLRIYKYIIIHQYINFDLYHLEPQFCLVCLIVNIMKSLITIITDKMAH